MTNYYNNKTLSIFEDTRGMGGPNYGCDNVPKVKLSLDLVDGGCLMVHLVMYGKTDVPYWCIVSPEGNCFNQLSFEWKNLSSVLKESSSCFWGAQFEDYCEAVNLAKNLLSMAMNVGPTDPLFGELFFSMEPVNNIDLLTNPANLENE